MEIARRNINNLRYANDTTLVTESKEEVKTLLMRVKEESKRAGLKLNLQKTKILAFSPIASWQMDSWQKNSNAGKDRGQEEKGVTEEKMVAPWKESYDQPRQHIEKQRDHFADKGLYSQSCTFSSYIYACELDYKEG